MEKKITDLIDLIKRSLKDGKKIDELKNQFISFGIDSELVETAIKRVETRQKKIRILIDPPEVHKKSESWYNGPSEDDIFWPKLKESLIQKEWDQKSVNSIDDASSKIVSFLDPPGRGAYNTRGLVLGYIQSGKTTNFTAVISKAADVGYKLFIVLSGITNSLRQQTQARLNNDIIALNPTYWVSFTSDTSDFKHTKLNANALLTQKAHQKFLCVVKKNHSILRNLVDWIKTAKPEILRDCPVIVIDDEADHASINVAGEITERSKINSLIHELLDSLTKRAYIGYTATPFANVLIDPKEEESLYPKDFIVSLTKPDDYVGAETIFGRNAINSEEDLLDLSGLNIINIIPESDSERLQPNSREQILEFTPTLAESMKEAVLYFWLVCSARYLREKVNKNYTMLIHTTRYTDPQLKFGVLVETFKDSILTSISENDFNLKTELLEIWNLQKSKLNKEQYPEFEHIYKNLELIVENTNVCVQNSRTDDDILYEYANYPRPYIIIGGDTLSRGLTLEGLIVSYFSRITKNYDTLLQMGRWFGYHKEYLNLIRIWMRAKYVDYFTHLATVEQEIRNDIYRYEQYEITPIDLAVRLQTHPSLNVTSRSKMKRAVISKSSYSGKKIQTLYFKHKDPAWLEKNKNATKNLIISIQKTGYIYEKIQGKHLFFNVDLDHIIKFFEDYQIHEKSEEIKTPLILNYLNEEKESHKKWDVVVMGLESETSEPIDLGLNEKVNLLNRSKKKPSNNQYAYLLGIVSIQDLLIDLIKEEGKSYNVSDITGMNDLSDFKRTQFKILEFRELQKPNIGLLILYPINKDSKPIRVDTNMTDLGAIDHIIGIGAYFPRNNKEDFRRKYISADLEDSL